MDSIGSVQAAVELDILYYEGRMSKLRPSFSAPVNTVAGWPGVTSPGGLTQISANQSLGLMTVLLGFYTLTLTVPVAEMLIVYWHVHIPVVWIADLFLTVGILLSGHFTAFFKSPLAKPWILLVVMFLIAAAVGMYPGRSIPFVVEYAVRFHVYPLYGCALALTVSRVRYVLKWIGWGSLLLLVLSLAYGKLGEGRLLLPNTDLANPNDLGLALLFTMPGLLVLKGKLFRILAFLALPVFVYQLFRTGSRACLVTMLVLSFILFLVVPVRTKLIMAILVPVTIAGIVAMVPASTMARITLIVSDPTRIHVNDQLQSAVASQAARTELQRRAVQVTVQHPLFGVGATMFEDAVEGMLRHRSGQKSGWQGAHNTFLEISAENGLAAVLFYTWALVLLVTMNYRAYKLCRQRPDLNDVRTQSLALMLMTITFIVCTTFSNNAYDTRICVLVGLTAANLMALHREIQGAGQPTLGIPNYAPIPTLRKKPFPVPVAGLPQRF
jgi:hypothetical protein